MAVTRNKALFAKSERIGNTLIAMGFFSLSVGLLSAVARAIKEELDQYREVTAPFSKGGAAAAMVDEVAKLIATVARSIVEILVVLRESPAWLVLIFLGLVLVLLGLWVKPARA